MGEGVPAWPCGAGSSGPAAVSAAMNRSRLWEWLKEIAETIRRGAQRSPDLESAELTRCGDHPATTLFEALAGAGANRRSETIAALVEVGKPAVPVLRDALRHPNANVRLEAVQALAAIGGKAAVWAYEFIDDLRVPYWFMEP